MNSTPHSRPRVAIPQPTSKDAAYNQRSWPQYAEAVTKAGGEPVEIPLGLQPASTAKLIAGCQGVLLPGSGADVNPQKYGQTAAPETAPACHTVPIEAAAQSPRPPWESQLAKRW